VAYPDELLADGERVVLHRHPHWRLLVAPVLAFLLVVGVAGYVAALARGQGWQAWGWPVIAAVAVLLVVVLTVAPVVRWRTTHLVVTTRRLLVREGVRKIHSLDVPLDRIAAVHARRTRLGRLVGCGSLVVAGVDGEVEFADVPGVDDVRALLRQLTKKAPTPQACPGISAAAQQGDDPQVR
jgi:membrane protein YdbS with pleckstrin-like domain